MPSILGSQPHTVMEIADKVVMEIHRRGAVDDADREKPIPEPMNWDLELRTRERVLDLIIRVSREEDINPLFVMAIVKAESNFNHRALSRAGAVGLMQVLPSTAMWVNSGLNVYNPEDNLRLGIRYFKMMRTKFKGYTRLALAAYNAGPRRVYQAGWKVPNIPETQVYVPRVMGYFNKYRRIASIV
jgi:soluble lytic murein transglycosylase-like protein